MEFRERPYSQFNFLVDLGNGDTASPQAGFQEVSGLNKEFTVAEYRNGNEKENGVRKLNGRPKYGDVTLKRGLIGSAYLFEWLRQVETGAQQESLREVTIQMQNEERTGSVFTWRLHRARPIKYTAPSLNAKGTDVAVEEFVLSIESMTVE